MNYRIIITKVEPNPKFAEEMEQREKLSAYSRKYMDETMPPRDITTDVLITEISPEQFKKVQAEVLKVFE
jgi:hypothetical protein